MSTQPETKILHAVRDALRYSGWLVIRHTAGLGSYAGLPDLQAIKDGRVVMVEVKTPKGRLSDAQAAFSRAWQLAGGEYVVARSVDDVAALVDCLPLSCAAMPARR